MMSLVLSKQEAAYPQQYLSFMLGREMFAIGILAIKEIIGYGQLTLVPMMPEFIRGVINLRGAVVPVIDLSARIGRQSAAVTKRTCIVIIEVAEKGETHVIGVVVDAVNEVLSCEIEPAPSFGAQIRTDFIRGMGKVDDKFMILLEVGKLLSIEDLSLLQHAGSSVEGSL